MPLYEVRLDIEYQVTVDIQADDETEAMCLAESLLEDKLVLGHDSCREMDSFNDDGRTITAIDLFEVEE